MVCCLVPVRNSTDVVLVNPRIGYDSQDFQFGFNIFSFDVEGWPVVTA